MRTKLAKVRETTLVGTAMLGLLACSQVLYAQQAASQAVPSTVPIPKKLTSGSCLDVSIGDQVTLDWNPAFDHAASVSGMREMTLRFAHPAEIASRSHNLGSVELTARPRQGDSDVPVKALDNGWYQITFRVRSANFEVGEYRLVQAIAIPETAAEYRGERPQMTNNPTSFPFCLNVVAPQRGRG